MIKTTILQVRKLGLRLSGFLKIVQLVSGRTGTGSHDCHMPKSKNLTLTCLPCCLPGGRRPDCVSGATGSVAEVCKVDGNREAGRREAKEKCGGGMCGSDLRQVTVGDVLKRRCDKPSCQVGYRHEESEMTP